MNEKTSGGVNMNWFTFAILSCISILTPSYARANSSLQNIFILAGQSNMAGRGGVWNVTNTLYMWNGYIPPESESKDSILRFSAKKQWERASEPLHWDIDSNKTNGIGPGMAFANELLAKAGSRAGTIGLVPCAIGRTHIKDWMKSPNKNETYYYNLIERIKGSESCSSGGKVRALLWFQGESDAANEPTAVAYQARLQQFFTDLRNDLKPRFVPIIMVKIATFERRIPHEDNDMAKVRAAQEAVSRALPDVKTVDALEVIGEERASYNQDQVHLNIYSQIQIGKLLANAYLSHYAQFL